MSQPLTQALSDLEEDAVLALVQERLDAGDDPLMVLADCREGMVQVGQRYESGEYYVSDLIMAGEIFKRANAILAEKFQSGASETRGKIVVGTVEGDIHDIGKDLVVGMLRANGYDVTDLGVDTPPAKFVEAVQATGATIVGLSGLLTISYDAMKETIAALKDSGLPVKVMIGGGPTTEQVREFVGADALGSDAQAAVSLCSQWIAEEEMA